MLGINLTLNNVALAARTLTQKAVAILRSFGSDAHVYMPGVGWMNGLQAGNYLESTGQTNAAVDSPVGKVDDANGSIDASQATTANKPILRRGAVNLALQSATPALQSITVTATPYTLALIGTGSVVVTGTGTGTLSGTGASDLVVLTFTPTAGAAIFTPVGSVTKIGVFKGTYTAAQIQALGGIPLTTTAPASTALGPYFWEFDGSNDSLSLGSVPFQMADDHCVIAAFAPKTRGAQQSIFTTSSTSSNAPLVCDLEMLINGYAQAYWRDDAGNIAQISSPTVVYELGAPTVTAARKVGNNKTLWVNGVQSGVTNTGVLGSTTTTTSTIGALIRTTTQYYLNGSLYPVIAIKGTVTEAQLLTLGKWVANASGVPI